ncbi:MAG: type II toxin-antitoxin system RelE/ParE family toxin [Nitrospinae bacterium]|nr:type II toxin-antitoxin system RelE/ParE family toxin [Nitrospinota bacterium]
MYRIVYSKQAAKAILNISRDEAQRIRKKLSRLAADPTAPNKNVKKLSGYDAFRLRVGDWRVIYSVHKGELEILVIKIASRGDVYK